MNLGKDKLASSRIGVVGGLLTFGAGVVTIASGGTAAPFIVGALAGSGAAAGIGGGVLGVLNFKENVSRERELKQRIREVMEKDVDVVKCLKSICQRVLGMDFDRREQVFREVQLTENELGCIAILFGAEKVMSVLKICLVSLEEILQEDSLIHRVGDSSTVNQVLKETAEIASEEAVEMAVEETIKTTVKIAGGTMIGFGGLTALWEGLNIKQSQKQAEVSESPVGNELRLLAKRLQSRIEDPLRHLDGLL